MYRCRPLFNAGANIMAHNAEGYELCIKAYEICNKAEKPCLKETWVDYFLLNSEGDVP
tara:strand:- start:47 stop:220 length:174 start_codon:yes stop_codon:yes gene_type:complete